MMKIPERIKKMKDPKGFYDLWIEKVSEGMTYEAAYDDLEQEYSKFVEDRGLGPILGERRYASYDSFRITNGKRIKNSQSPN